MSDHEYIPLSVPFQTDCAVNYVKECLETGWVSSAGKYVNRFESAMADYTKSKFAVACSSGTAALQVALEIVGVEPEDEVIVPTLTFIATINAVKYRGAFPVFMDCDDYFNIDVDKVRDFLTKETIVKNGELINKRSKRRIRAVVPVHVFGHAVNMKALVPLCRKYKLKIVEDATESLGTIYNQGSLKGRHAGTIGDIGCLSFNGNKIITTGGGGMILTSKQVFAKKAQHLTTQAKNDGVYFVHKEIGYNFRMNNMQAALGLSQLEILPEILLRKDRNFQGYRALLSTIDGLWLQRGPEYANQNYWMYPLRIDSKRYRRSRDELIGLFQQNKVEVRPIWYLNHWQKPYKDCQAYKIEKAIDMWKTTINIPCSADLTDPKQEIVIDLLRGWRK